jgi:hypothetical protein
MARKAPNWSSDHDPRQRPSDARAVRSGRRAVGRDRKERLFSGADPAAVVAFTATSFTAADPDACTVVIPEFPRRGLRHVQACDDLKDFLRLHRIRRINSGLCKAGYAVRFPDKTMATAFRLLWQGRTTVPEPPAAL